MVKARRYINHTTQALNKVKNTYIAAACRNPSLFFMTKKKKNTPDNNPITGAVHHTATCQRIYGGVRLINIAVKS